jgi:hypothetical protein
MCEECGCHEGETCDCDCHSHHDTCECGCHGGHFERRYQTKAEKIADLEGYLMDLKLEVQAVEEHLADLRK